MVDLPKEKQKPYRKTEYSIGNTIFTVISVQSENAKETAEEKLKKLMLKHMADVCENISINSHISGK